MQYTLEDMEEINHKIILEVGRLIYLKYFGPAALDWPIGQDLKFLATQWLFSLGFERIEWVQQGDDILLCLLWFEDQQWIIEFADTDASIISVFQFMGEVTM